MSSNLAANHTFAFLTFSRIISRSLETRFPIWVYLQTSSTDGATSSPSSCTMARVSACSGPDFERLDFFIFRNRVSFLSSSRPRCSDLIPRCFLQFFCLCPSRCLPRTWDGFRAGCSGHLGRVCNTFSPDGVVCLWWFPSHSLEGCVAPT